MVSHLRYITHSDAAVEPSKPSTRWGLSPWGLERARALLDEPWTATIGRIVSSDETKAMETAEVLAAHAGLQVEVRARTGENDRSSTGYVPPEEFELLADQFFARPDESVRGWERATDAQARIVAALSDLLDSAAGEDIAVIGHGGVGTLWYCRLTDQAIDRRHDQPGQGHYFTVDLDSGEVVHPWRPIDCITRDTLGYGRRIDP